MSEEISNGVKQQVNLMEEVRELKATMKQRPEDWTTGTRIEYLEQYSHVDDLIVSGLSTKHHRFARAVASDRG